jgi:hypothetical protein
MCFHPNRRFHETLFRYGKLGTIATPTNFIAHKRTMKQRTRIILTTQMAKAFYRFKTQSKQILDGTNL